MPENVFGFRMVVFHLLAHKHIRNHRPLTLQGSRLELEMLPPVLGHLSVVTDKKSNNLYTLSSKEGGVQKPQQKETSTKSLWRLAMHLPKSSVKHVLTAFSTVPS